MPKQSKKSGKDKAVARMFAESEGERFALVVRRGGNAKTREVIVEGKIRLDWLSNGHSKPVELPAGTYTLECMVTGKKDQTFSFSVVSPHEEPLGVGTLTDLGAETFDREVRIP